MPSGVLSAVVQLVLALIASGVVVKLLTVRQDRRKIAGDASTSEANAASTLSGAALQMVEAANKSARDAEKREAAAQAENQRLWQELNTARWAVYHRDVREAVLLQAFRERGIAIPPMPEHADEVPGFPPPDVPPQT